MAGLFLALAIICIILAIIKDDSIFMVGFSVFILSCLSMVSLAHISYITNYNLDGVYSINSSFQPAVLQVKEVADLQKAYISDKKTYYYDKVEISDSPLSDFTSILLYPFAKSNMQVTVHIDTEQVRFSGTPDLSIKESMTLIKVDNIYFNLDTLPTDVASLIKESKEINLLITYDKSALNSQSVCNKFVIDIEE